MSEPLRHYTIVAAERALDEVKRAYLQSWGWTPTSQTPGSLWLWQHPNVPRIGPMTCGMTEAINATSAWNGIEGQWLDERGLLNMDD